MKCFPENWKPPEESKSHQKTKRSDYSLGSDEGKSGCEEDGNSDEESIEVLTTQDKSKSINDVNDKAEEMEDERESDEEDDDSEDYSDDEDDVTILDDMVNSHNSVAIDRSPLILDKPAAGSGRSDVDYISSDDKVEIENTSCQRKLSKANNVTDNGTFSPQEASGTNSENKVLA